MYEYETPSGYGDTFFIYNVNGEDIPLVNGSSYSLVGLPVEDGMFVCRVWSGGILLVNATTGTVQMYDGVKCAWFQLPILQGNFPPSMAVLPEKVYRDNSALRFDLANVALKTNSNGTANVYADQMAWYGAKRVLGGPSDPLPSLYKYYEKPFSYPIAFGLTNFGPSGVGGIAVAGLSAPTQYSILIQDFDFELRRISVFTASGTAGSIIFGGEEPNGSIKFAGTGGTTINMSAANIGVPNQVATVTVVGTVITINVATDAGGNEISTVAQIVALVAATPAAALLVTASQIIVGTLPVPNFGIISGGGGGGGSAYASPFKILLYDATWRQRMSVPILSELLCHNPSTVPPPSTMPNNCWPSPPMMYPVNSVIRFDVFSLIPTGDALPVNVGLVFEGVRRIAC
jgi:hypothetical protein